MLTRKQFDKFTRKLSVQDPTDGTHHCRVEICVADDWRVMTDSCMLEENIPEIHSSLSGLLWVYIKENFPNAKPPDCRKLGAPTTALDKGMRVW